MVRPNNPCTNAKGRATYQTPLEKSGTKPLNLSHPYLTATVQFSEVPYRTLAPPPQNLVGTDPNQMGRVMSFLLLLAASQKAEGPPYILKGAVTPCWLHHPWPQSDSSQTTGCPPPPPPFVQALAPQLKKAGKSPGVCRTHMQSVPVHRHYHKTQLALLQPRLLTPPFLPLPHFSACAKIHCQQHHFVCIRYFLNLGRLVGTMNNSRARKEPQLKREFLPSMRTAHDFLKTVLQKALQTAPLLNALLSQPLLNPFVHFCSDLSSD